MKTIFRNEWLVLFLLIPFFKPISFQYYSNLSLLESGYVIFKVLVAVISFIFLCLYLLQYKKIPKLYIWVFLFEGSILFSTIYKHGNTERAIIDLISMSAYVIIFDLGMKYSKNTLIKSLTILLSFLVIINFVAILIYNSGLPADLYFNNFLNPLFFMTLDNGTALFLLFYLTIVFLKDYTKKINLEKFGWFMSIISILSAILSGSSTAILAVIIYFTSIKIESVKGIRIVKNYRRWVLLYGIVFSMIMFARNSKILSFILISIFGKNASYTGRDYLWAEAYKMIEKSPYIGFGRISSDYLSVWGGYFSSHNFVLELLLQGGYVALIIFIFIVIMALVKLQSNKFSKSIKVLQISLFISLVVMLMESTVHSVYLFGLIVLCFNSNLLEE